MSTDAASDSWSPPSPGIRLLRAAIDFAFPTRCAACGREPVVELFAGGVCRTCWRAIPLLPERRCSVCDDPLYDGSGHGGDFPGDAEAEAAGPCGRCILDPPLYRSLRSAAPYRGSARSIVAAFKFHGGDYLAGHLARIMVREIGSETTDAPPDEVVPVPATALSRIRRDHAADLLAAAVARRLEIPCSPRRLRKTRRTQKQSGLPARLRPGNVRGAFRGTEGTPRRILLVDDVATSGATVRECAGALLHAGAERVDVWCFARATREDNLAESIGDALAAAEGGQR